jgi:hypothetical protein
LPTVKGAVEKIHPDEPQSFLLVDVCFVEQPNMDNDLAWLPPGLGLKPHAQPAMRFITLFETARRDGVGEDKERFLDTKFSIKSFDQKIVLVVEHCL